MTKAEQKALEAYPEKPVYNEAWGEDEDINVLNRIAFHEGYLQAEKDLALTWEDMLTIHEKIRAVYDIAIMAEMDSKQIYEEVLRRFNKAKEEQQ